ncbi:MAG TPA: calcium-binding protein [Solirubrobacterales bacterium]|nr:calcium-binding protein [Solirubrobacterales bacterium]
MRRIGLAIAVVVAALLAFPALAAAAIQVQVDSQSLTVTGDDQANQIELSVGPAGKIAVNDVETTLQAGRVFIAVNAGAGADTLEAGTLGAADYGSMVVRGGVGNDFLIGGGADDNFLWANGDNSDEVVGASGNDQLDLTGNLTEADNLFFRPSTRQPGWVFLRRQESPGVGTFEIELLDIETTAIHLEGGNDFSANEGPIGIGTLTHLRIDGGFGNDQLGGSNGADDIDGGPGEDLLAGAEGNDRLFGGADADRIFGEDGDDRMVWANGDGRDEDTGGAGDDEVGLSGHPTLSDALFYRQAPRPGWVLLRRLEPPDGSVRAFEIELLEVETFSIDTMGGSDKVEGEGLEGIGDLTDLVLAGGFGDDNLAASDGDDQLLGGPGEDLLFDGPGDDTLVWQPGDGSDEVRAFPGAPEENDGLIAFGSQAGDNFLLSREAGVTTLAGAVPAGAPFEIGTEALAGNGGIESFSILAEGGADEVVVEPGMPEIRVLAAGGEGDDHLAGGEESDLLRGGLDNDTLTGGDGFDFLVGDEGDDRLLSRDGEADQVDGGAGIDGAVTDALSLDEVIAVEDVDAAEDPGPDDPGPDDPGPDDPGPGDPGPVDPGDPVDPGPKQPDPESPERPQSPAPDTLALLPSIGRLSLAQSGKALLATVPVSCPAAEAGGCRTAVTVETAKSVRLGARKAILKLGSAKLDLAPGATATAKVRLNRRAAALLERGKLPVRVRIASTDAAGNAASGSLARVLKPR